MNPKILILVGPTASGKTEVALEISKIIPSEMISCDSMQVYKSMPIVSQSPPKEVTRKLKTHLVNFLKPTDEYSAALFRKDAQALIRKIIKAKKTPLIVGGTGLYLRALLDGLFESENQDDPTPTRDLSFREKLLTDQAKYGAGYLHQMLQKIDPISATKVHPNDSRRVIRALEVFHLTGKPFSAQAANRSGIRQEFKPKIFFLERDRAALYDRINERVDQMLEQGLVNEVKKLSKKNLSRTANAALGLKEIKSFLDKKISLPEALALLKQNTRRYAKRQISWFKHEKDVEMVVVGSKDNSKLIAKKIIQKWRDA